MYNQSDKIIGEGLKVHLPELDIKERELRILNALKEVEINPSYLNRFPHELSGGQRQKIALARALIRKPKFLLLDDALSNVDSSTEIKIMNYIKSSLKNTAIVLTSNRLSVLSFCNQICVLKSGNLIQEGLHKELIKEDGEYQKLFFNQMLS